MRKCIAVFLIAALALGLSVPAFAEPQYVTTVFLPPEKDEAYWEREFRLNKEQDWEVNGLPEYTGPEANAPAPTEAELAKWKEDAQKALEEHQQWQETDLSLESERRGKLMEQVFGDKLHEFSVPETTFEGNYQEFTGNDGSVTRVYEDGSVDTKYADGSWEGMDNQGNRVAEDKDGNRTISFINGDTGTYRDGTLTVKQTDGATVTYRPDDTISWTNDTGLVIDYNANGERTAIGFEGGDKVELVHGQLPPGDQKITGPNGAYLDWHNGNTSELSEDGMSVVDGDGNYGLKVKGTNGATGRLEIDPEYNPHIDEEATIAEKQKNNGKGGEIYTSDTKIDVSSMDGSALEIVSDNNHDDKISVTYQDPDGNVSTDKQFGNGFFEKTYESADGKERYHESLDENGLNAEYTDKDGTHKLAETTVNEDGSVSIKYDGGAEIRMNPDGTTEGDFANGVKIALDKDGNPRELSAEGERYTFDEDGKLLEAEFTLPDGSRIAKDETGCKMIRPDGEELTVDAEGNVYDKNGELVKGAHDDEGFDDPSKRAKPETADAQTPEDDFTGGYYGTYTYTAYWDGGKQRQGNRAYYVYAYNGCYYLAWAKDPNDVKALIQEHGVDGFFKGYYDGDLTAENASFDPATRTGTYLEKSYMNDVQYISTVYTFTFDGGGGLTVSWESQNVYKDSARPQESGTFTGSRK